MPTYRKGEEPNVKDLLKYRVITILPAISGVWSGMRYRHTTGWAETWADEAQYSARKRRGAHEAWWKANLEMELDRTRQCE